MILCLSLLSVTAFAASASASLTGKETVRAGDTITLTFKLNGSGLYGVSGTLSYDSAQLTLTDTTQKIGSPWMVEWNGGNFVAYDNNLSDPIDSNTAIFSVTFKVKSDLATGTQVMVSCTGVTASDGSADSSVGTVSYSVKIAAPLSGDCALGSLDVSNATISPAFDSTVTSYTASVPYEVDRLKIDASANHSGASVKVDNPTLTVDGTTDVTITVTAENGQKKTYTISVTRAQDPNYVPSSDTSLSGITVDGFVLSPQFSVDRTDYVIWLPYETESVLVSAEPGDNKASVEVIGGSELVAGQDNEIQIVCTAENGTQKIYTVIAKRAPSHDATEETDPTETQPVETQPAPTQPTETEPEQTQPATQPEETPEEEHRCLAWWWLLIVAILGAAGGFALGYFLRKKD